MFRDNECYLIKMKLDNAPETLRNTVWDNLGEMVPDRISEVYDRPAGLARRMPPSSMTIGDVPCLDLTRRFLYAGLPSKRVRWKVTAEFVEGDMKGPTTPESDIAAALGIGGG